MNPTPYHIVRSVFLIFLGILIIGCKDDDIPIIVYDFEENFKDVEIGQVEVPSDPPITITQQNPASFSGSSDDTNNLVADITDGSTNANSQSIIDGTQSFSSAYFSLEDSEIAENLNSENVADLLGQPLSTQAQNIAQNALAEADNYGISELLPSISYEFGSGTAKESGITIPDIQGVSAEDFAGYPGEASCYVSAENAYQAAIAPAVEARDEAIATVTATYQQRVAEAEAREAERIAAINEEYQTNLQILNETANELLDAAANLTEAEEQQAIQELVYIYLVAGKELLDTYKAEAIAYAAELKAQEIQEAEDRLNELLVQIDADFEEAIAQAKALRDNAFNNCHNQGG